MHAIPFSATRVPFRRLPFLGISVTLRNFQSRMYFSPNLPFRRELNNVKSLILKPTSSHFCGHFWVGKSHRQEKKSDSIGLSVSEK